MKRKMFLDHLFSDLGREVILEAESDPGAAPSGVLLLTSQNILHIT